MFVDMMPTQYLKSNFKELCVECKSELTRYGNLVIGSKFQARKSEKNEMMKWMYTVQSKAYSISESL